MTKAPPAEQAMHRDHVAEVVEEDVKLDASEFDGCWLVIPDHKCKFCCDTHLLVQKHVDADTVVAKSVYLSVWALCWPFESPCLAYVCCPRTFVGLRTSDADDGSKNSFDYLQGKTDVDRTFPDDMFDDSEEKKAMFRREKPEYYPKAIYYAPGFESRGQRCTKSRKTKANMVNNTWQYSGGSRARSRLWNPHARHFVGAPPLSESEAVRFATYSCLPPCLPPTFDRDLQILAAYYSGSRRKDDRPLTAAEQEDEIVCHATFAGALEAGNLPVLRRYRAVVGALEPGHARVLAGNGHLEALQWARDEGVEFPPNICVVAASSGNVDVLKYCKESGAPCDDADIMFHAVKSGSVECVEYCLKTLKLPWGDNAIRTASNSSPEMLGYCLYNGAPEDIDAIRMACHCTDLDVVKVFAESSHPFPSNAETILLSGHTLRQRKEDCDAIEAVCAGKGYSVRYEQMPSD